VNSAPYDAWVILAELLGEHLAAVRGQRHPLHRGAHHLQHRREWQVPQDQGEPLEKAEEHCFVPAREAGRQQHQRPGERARPGHLQCDVRAHTETHHNVAAQVGSALCREAREVLDAEVLRGRGAAHSRHCHRNHADTRQRRLSHELLVLHRCAHTSRQQQRDMLCIATAAFAAIPSCPFPAHDHRPTTCQGPSSLVSEMARQAGLESAVRNAPVR